MKQRTWVSGFFDYTTHWTKGTAALFFQIKQTPTIITARLKAAAPFQ